MLYPLLFDHNFHTTVWGGHRLKPMKRLPADAEPIGESWEVSAVPSSVSVVSNGSLQGQDLRSLTARYRAQLLGYSVFKRYNGEFPLLVKFIDADKDLSIQVHPDDELARQRHGTFGKTEMWYVMAAEPGACLYSGLNQPVSRYEFEHRVADGSICEVLAKHPVKAGDVFFIPAGRIHAICGGILLAEVQQSSDITYRLFDYNRPGLDGKPRQLHVAEALEAIDFNVPSQQATLGKGSRAAVAPQPLLAGQHADISVYRSDYEPQRNYPVPLIVNEFFIVKLLEIDRAYHRNMLKYDTFVIYMCLEGECSIRLCNGSAEVRLTPGNSCLVPACVADYFVEPIGRKTRVLETYIDNKNY